ncbi:hypothetical protein, partial [Paenibacillus sp. MY03]|uniref:hypothetical protein n=1 Tax=Paenibacillus sp. MY03 TaxID=302980 RepID=UPI001C4EB89E
VGTQTILLHREMPIGSRIEGVNPLKVGKSGLKAKLEGDFPLTSSILIEWQHSQCTHNHRTDVDYPALNVSPSI